MKHTSRPALARRSRTSTIRVAFAALLVGLFAVVGVAPAQAAGGGRYTALTDDSNGPIAITGRGLDGQTITRTLNPGGRTDAEGFANVSVIQLGARTSVTRACYVYTGGQWSKYDEKDFTNPSYGSGLITSDVCRGDARMTLRVRIYPN